ncbi:DEAD/DEAH box helicase [Halococcoides cellulosivorans]|uniref:Helicase ATP-binding domain-containing protein n=1 Tax=Halococcoides cellulosivorans TaxID=1679096 RepID=A0A2R4X402_9EURY|nr:hypothetical protein [Halococcoides cellulosivorans]AWB28517.1 hypothetical protein HARCEL1_12910 [Halococcoides cellulosivorans]
MTGGSNWDDFVDNSPIFKSSELSDYDKAEWPRKIDYIAKRVSEGEYVVGNIDNQQLLSDGWDVEDKARDYYLEGIAALTGDRTRETALPDTFDIGALLVEFQELRGGLADVNRDEIPAGEILSRLLTRTIQRQSSGSRADLASQLRPDTETPRELVAELTSAPELADVVSDAVPDTDNPSTLAKELASLDLSTELWDHQLESLALWLHHGSNGYVDMATATGKTVLGLAAVAHTVDSGSLHPADQHRLEDIFDGAVPEPDSQRPNNVLIVTTDDLLGIQWSRLFQEHCHTPEEFTRVTNRGIQLPRMEIEIRSAGSLDDLDPADYGLAIFDEVHNYGSKSGWGDNLVSFVDSVCPVLALTGSVTEPFKLTVRRANKNFPVLYRYTHELALADGVIPDFEWTLWFTDVIESDALDRLRTTSDRIQEMITYEEGKLHVERSAVASVAPELEEETCEAIAGKYTSGTALANQLREVGGGETAPTEWLESLAKGLSDRTLDRLNLSADLDAIVTEAERSLAEKRPTLVLTRTYGETKALWQQLYDGSDDRVVERLEAGGSAEEHASTIREFDEAETEEKVLIGPGNRIGQGNDIHSVEVGINIAKPGSGVNATLVQRLGRLLRDAGSKDTVDFYHVMGVQPRDTAVEPDGESFVQTVSEFFGQVIEPDTDGILKSPTVRVNNTVSKDVAALERLGADSLRLDARGTVIEAAYAAAIQETPLDKPAVETDWFSAAYGVTTPSQEMVSTDDQQQDEDDRENDNQTPLSPLAEHYDAFRSLGIIHRGLQNIGLSEIDHEDPFQQWVRLVKRILNEEGFGEQSVGYGSQLAASEAVDIDDYREFYGDGKRITEFETVTVTQPPSAVLALIGDRFANLDTWYVPLAPDSETPLPVLVESQAELRRAKALLEEFASMPPEQSFTEDQENRDTSQSVKKQPENTQAENELADTPVADVRGVSSAAAEAFSAAGFETLSDLQTATDEELVSVEGPSEQRIKLIRASIGRI